MRVKTYNPVQNKADQNNVKQQAGGAAITLLGFLTTLAALPAAVIPPLSLTLVVTGSGLTVGGLGMLGKGIFHHLNTVPEEQEVQNSTTRGLGR